MRWSRTLRKFARRGLRRLPSAMLASWVIAGWCRSLRWDLEQAVECFGLLSRNQQPLLLAFWHNRIFVMPWLYRHLLARRRLKVMISASRDGQWITDVAARFGVEAVRGSSSQGGARALISMTREIHRSGCDLAVTPDGPRGPRYVVQPGVALLSRRTGLPVVPLTVHYEKKWEMKSWDRFQIPWPFSGARMVVGEPLAPPVDEHNLESWCEELARRLGH